MAAPDPVDLPAPQRIAVAYSSGAVRPVLLALLSLDARLGQTLVNAREPLLAQMRLAWWREELAKPAGERGMGDPVLDALGEHWRGGEAALAELIDGWEQLLGEAPLPASAIEAFAEGRGAAFAELAELVAQSSASGAARRAGRRWALADLAFRITDPVEQERCRVLFDSSDRSTHLLPRALRGLALLDGLATRAMARGEPLMAGRGAALAAMRLGMIGR